MKILNHLIMLGFVGSVGVSAFYIESSFAAPPTGSSVGGGHYKSRMINGKTYHYVRVYDRATKRFVTKMVMVPASAKQ